MSMDSGKFSKRHGFKPRPTTPLIYHEAPTALRVGLLAIVENELGLSSKAIRSFICKAFKMLPDANNWSDQNIDSEIQSMVMNAEWYEIYDLIEAFEEHYHSYYNRSDFATHVNSLLEEENIGWRLEKGKLIVHGEPETEAALEAAEEIVSKSKFRIAKNELMEARLDLSRRPEPDMSGAISHAASALESISRQLTDAGSDSLGKIIKDNPHLFPKPVDTAIHSMWGYASEQARHGREDRQLNYPEVFLLVHSCGVLCAYLCEKFPDK